MSRWFPALDNHGGVRKALDIGIGGAVALALMNVFGIAYLLLTRGLPVSGTPADIARVLLIVGCAIRITVILIAARRFKIGKGLLWGIFILLLLASEVLWRVFLGKSNVIWFVLYAAVAAALIVGIRGAWAARKMPEQDYAEVFE
jgi:hypothetical protein